MDKTIDKAIEFARSISPSSRDPKALSLQLGIDIISDKPLSKDGYLVCESGCKIIFVSSYVSNTHRRKFIISHEIGHFLLHRNHLFCCSDINEASPLKINTPLQEIEANDFASEYLLPASQLTEFIPKDSIHFTDISKMAKHFDVSMTFAAIKAIRRSKGETETLICYEHDKLKWYLKSNPNYHKRDIPYKCPIDLCSAKTETDITGAWDDLYEGSVHQEIFHPIPTQSLILLSGNRYNAEVDYDDF